MIIISNSRSKIPDNIANYILFLSDRTCCVCRVPNKSIQIHHIDGNPNNHDIDNLTLLCLQCHDDTQIKGGFGRKLNQSLIKIYRNDWYFEVNVRRKKKLDETFEFSLLR